jgi:FkbM family methyltransferase
MRHANAAPSHDGPRDIVLRGRPLRVTDDKPTFWDKAAAGGWEPELLAAIERHLAPGGVFLDIGAWVGPTTLHAALLGAQVVAVEADPVAAGLLEGNVAANPSLAPHITVLRRAAAPVAGRVRLGAPRKPGDSMSSALHADLSNAWEAEAATPSDLLAAAIRAGDGPLVVKVDIEGGEYSLLPALVPVLPPGRITALVVAFHPALLRGAGRGVHDVAAATGLCFSALQGWMARVIDAPAGGGAQEIASKTNCTVVFTPAGRE